MTLRYNDLSPYAPYMSESGYKAPLYSPTFLIINTSILFCNLKEALKVIF